MVVIKKCLNCSSDKVKTQVNYTHGRNSRAKRVSMCSVCGSTNISSRRGRSR